MNRPDDELWWLGRVTISVPEAGVIIGLTSKQGAYDAAKRGDIPTIRMGRKIFVPVAKLRALLGEAS